MWRLKKKLWNRKPHIDQKIFFCFLSKNNSGILIQWQRNWRKSQNTFNKSVQYHFNLQILLPKTLKSWKPRFGLKKVAKSFQTKKWLRRQVRRWQSNPRKQDDVVLISWKLVRLRVKMHKNFQSKIHTCWSLGNWWDFEKNNT